jgi:hypothetical protein
VRVEHGLARGTGDAGVGFGGRLGAVAGLFELDDGRSLVIRSRSLGFVKECPPGLTSFPGPSRVF